MFIKQNRRDKIEGDRKRGRQKGRGQTEKERQTTRDKNIETETDKLRERQKERYETDRHGFPGGRGQSPLSHTLKFLPKI